MNEKIEINQEIIKSLEKETRKKFTKILINHLKEKLKHPKPEENIYNQLEYKRIVTLIEKEKNNNFLKRFSKEIKDNIIILKVSFENKSETIKVLGNTKLKDLSFLIQEKFNLDSCHLYEFEIGKYKFGPKCDEWEEIFDHLDNYRLDYAIHASDLRVGDHFNFIFDFGDNLGFDIEIVNILE